MPDEEQTTEEDIVERIENGEEMVPVEDAIEYAISDSSVDEEALQNALESFRASDHGHEVVGQNLVVEASEDGTVRISTNEDFVDSIELNEDSQVININVDSEHEYLQQNDQFTVDLTYSNEEGRTTRELDYTNPDPDTLHCFTRGFESQIEEENEEIQTPDEMVEELVDDTDNTEYSGAGEDVEEGVQFESNEEVVAEVEHEDAELTSETEMIERDRNVYNVSNISDERRLRTMAQDIETRVDQLLSKRQRIVEKLERIQEGEE